MDTWPHRPEQSGNSEKLLVVIEVCGHWEDIGWVKRFVPAWSFLLVSMLGFYRLFLSSSLIEFISSLIIASWFIFYLFYVFSFLCSSLWTPFVFPFLSFISSIILLLLLIKKKKKKKVSNPRCLCLWLFPSLQPIGTVVGIFWELLPIQPSL